jgi:hypothetical protein
MCNSRPTQLITPAETPKAEEVKRDPATLNPQKRVCLAKLFMHNPKFAEAFFKARIGMSPLFLLSPVPGPADRPDHVRRDTDI